MPETQTVYRCAACDAVTPTRPCTGCGERRRLVPAEYCPCGEVVDAGDARCPGCGRLWDTFELSDLTVLIRKVVESFGMRTQIDLITDGWRREIWLCDVGIDYHIIEIEDKGLRLLSLDAQHNPHAEHSRCEALIETIFRDELISALVAHMAAARITRMVAQEPGGGRIDAGKDHRIL